MESEKELSKFWDYLYSNWIKWIDRTSYIWKFWAKGIKSVLGILNNSFI
jgi:hypothetical protein